MWPSQHAHPGLGSRSSQKGRVGPLTTEKGQVDSRRAGSMAHTPWHRGGQTRTQSSEMQGSEDTQERGHRGPRPRHMDRPGGPSRGQLTGTGKRQGAPRLGQSQTVTITADTMMSTQDTMAQGGLCRPLGLPEAQAWCCPLGRGSNTHVLSRENGRHSSALRPLEKASDGTRAVLVKKRAKIKSDSSKHLQSE